jgi:hypothetical protein
MTSGTWHVATSPLPWMDPAIRQLAEVWRDEQVRLQIYTRDEMDALELPTSDPTRECSWAAPPNQQQGPWSLRAMANGKVIAGGLSTGPGGGLSTGPGGGLSTGPGGGMSTGPGGGLSTGPGGGLFTGAGEHYHSNTPPRDAFLQALRDRGMDDVVQRLLRSGF